MITDAHIIEDLRWRERTFCRVGGWLITVGILTLLAFLTAGWVANQF